jgi:hypothetical protein
MQEPDRPFRGRRLTWQQFFEVRPDRRPANDNQAVQKDDGSRGTLKTPPHRKAHSAHTPSR